jgi:hypothetical protein
MMPVSRLKAGTLGRDDRVAKVIADAPVSARGILVRALDGTGGRKNAIAAMCLYCTGYDRETVRSCTAWSCPLWQWRPFQPAAETPVKSGVGGAG